MSPPISGSLHTNVARTGDDLLHTESCFCTSNYCNSGAPLMEARKEMRCAEKVQGSFWGHSLTSSRKRDCLGEFCFTSDLKSDHGQASEFSISGCIAFTNGSRLNEELNPTGCGYFSSEGLLVRTCFHSNDQKAIDRSLHSRIERMSTSLEVSSKPTLKTCLLVLMTLYLFW